MGFSFKDSGFIPWDMMDVYLSGYDQENDAFEYAFFSHSSRVVDFVVMDGFASIGNVDDEFLFLPLVELNDVPKLKVLDKDTVNRHVMLCQCCYENAYLDELEKEGFSKKAYFTGGDFPHLQGKPFSIVSRQIGNNDPGWLAMFDDRELFVYPEEVVPSKMREAGCPYSDEEYGISVPKKKTAKHDFAR